MANPEKPIRVKHPDDSTYVEFYGMSLRQKEVLEKYRLLTRTKEQVREDFYKENKLKPNDHRN